MKLEIPRAPITPDVDAALDRLLFDMIVGAIEREHRAAAAPEMASPTGTDRDPSQDAEPAAVASITKAAGKRGRHQARKSEYKIPNGIAADGKKSA